MSDSGKTQSHRRTKRVVVVRRAQAENNAQASPARSKQGKRRVVVARQPKPGEEIVGNRLENPATATFRYDTNGNLLPHSYLADEDDEDALYDDETMQDGTMMGDTMGTTPGTAQGSMRRGLLDRPSSRALTARSINGSQRSLRSAVEDVDPVEARKNAATKTLEFARTARVKQNKERSGMLKNLAIHERTALQKEERARKRWEQQQREWQRFKKNMAAKLGRDESKLVVSHAEEYREMVEEYDMIQKATPPDQKHGSEYWMMSLRGEGTRYVAIGNIFSGLFCPVKDDDKPLAEVIRRPRRRMRTTASGNETTELPPHDPKSWRNGHALKRRKRQLRHRIKELRPHVVGEEDSIGLAVSGINLFDWANRSADMLAPGGAGSLASEGKGPEVDEVDGKAEENSGDSESKSGPRLALQVITDASTLPGSVGASLGMGQDPSELGATALNGMTGFSAGPAAAAIRGWPRVLFDVGIATEARSVLRLRNVGSTALFYEWRPVDRGGVTAAGSTIRPQSADSSLSGAAAAPRGVSRFLCASTEGMVLPGDSFDFVFTFKSPNAGVFRESWQLHTTPPANDAMRIRIALRGVATEQDEGAPARKALEKKLELNSIKHAVEDILWDVVNSVKTPRGPPTAEEVLAGNRERFTAGNKGLHFSPEIYAKMAELHAVALGNGEECKEEWDGTVASISAAIASITPNAADEAAVAAAAAAAEAEDEPAAKGKAKPKKGKKGKGAAEEEPMQLKPLTAAQLAQRRQGELRTALGDAVAAASSPAPEDTGLYAVARQVLCELAESVPQLAGATRMALELPLREGLDAAPGEEEAAAIEAQLEAKRRKARRAARGSDDESDEDEDEEEEEDDDEDEDDEAAQAAKASEAELAALPAEEQYPQRLANRVRAAVGTSVKLFAQLAATASAETTSAVRAAVGMALPAKLGLEQVAVEGQVVVLRTDLNASLTAAGEVTAAGQAKVAAAVPTIKHLIAEGASAIVVASHLGRPPTQVGALPGSGPDPAQLADFEDASRLSLRPYAAALEQALGTPVAFAEGGVKQGRAAVEAAVKQAGGARPAVVLLENLRLEGAECADEAMYSLSGRRVHLPSPAGVPLLDGSDVREWSPAQVALWLHRLCPGIASAARWGCYRRDWCDKGITGATLLAATPATLALWGVAQADSAVLTAGIAALRRRAQAEAAARATDEAWAAVPVPSHLAALAEAEGDIGAKELAQRSATQRIAALRATLSKLGDVFVNDVLGVCHSNNSSVVGVRPRASRIVAMQKQQGAGASAAAAGLRVAGLRLARELGAWGAVLDGGAVSRPLVAVVGGSDVAGKARTLEHLLTLADEVILGGVLGVLWAKVVAGAAVGAVGCDATAEATIRRLAGLAARRGVAVTLPVDFVTGDQAVEGSIEAALVKLTDNATRLRNGEEVKGEEDEEEDEDDDDDDDDDDSDDEEAAAARKAARAEAKAAKKAAAEAEAARRRALALRRLAADPSDSGDVEGAVEVEYEGDTAEVVLAEGGVADADFALDIGPDTRELVQEQLSAAGTIVWTGPVGAVEVADCQGGTRELVDALNDLAAAGTTVLAAGGATAAWLEKFSLPNKPKVTHYTAGGAAIKRLLQGGLLPGVAVLSEETDSQ